MEYNVILLIILLLPIVGSFFGYLIGMKDEKRRDIINIEITGVVLFLSTLLYKPVSIQPIDISVNHIMGTGLHLRLDVFRFIFLWITCLVWFLATIYSTRYLTRYKNRNRYHFFFMLTLGSTIGIFISENFLNLFTFFEIMSFTSYALIIHDEDDYSHDAGNTYIVTAVAGGLVLLMGLFLLYNYTQTLDISKLYAAVKGLGTVKYLISGLLIVGFGVKAGIVPLHVWLPKAHPAAPAPASAVLSGILLKTGIFGIMLTIDIMLREDFYLSIIMLVIGFMNMFIGGLLAMFQRNIKRILAYSSMSQIGYIIVGIGLIGILGEHNAIAIYATLFHVINHAIFKVLLFMGAGIIYMVLHELSINEIGGFGRNRTPLKIIFFIGLLAIIGMPGFNGYASKTLLHEALYEAHTIYHTQLLTVAEVIFTLSSSFTVAYLLKIFVAVFIEKSQHNFDNVDYKPCKETLIPLIILSGLVIYIGIRPDTVMHILGGALGTFEEAHHLEINFFSLNAVKSALTTILLGCFIYIVFIRKVLRKGTGDAWYYINPALKWFNLENNLYKPVGTAVFHICSLLLKIVDGALVGTATFIGRTVDSLGELEVKYAKSTMHFIRKEIDIAVNSIRWNKLVKQKDNCEQEQDEFEAIKQNKFKEAMKDKIDDIKGYEKAGYSIKEIIGSMIRKMNSVTYSIFIFAAVLVTCLLVLIS